MGSNTFGKLFTLTTFGESHGTNIGGVIDGFPSNFEIDYEIIKKELSRRKPSKSFETARIEEDKFSFLSGIFEGKTTGMPISYIIDNSNKNSKDYDLLENIYRPSHADYTYYNKFGIKDHRGGGRSSARETTSWVIAGSIAKQYLSKMNIEICGYVSQIGEIKLNTLDHTPSPYFADQFETACPNKNTDKKIIEFLNKIKLEKDTCGGIVSCVVKNLPLGLGEPIFDKLPARLAQAMMTLNAVKGFEIGEGFKSASMKGSEHNDEFIIENDKIKTKTNHSGGTLGGISNGENLYFNVAFKPIASILKKQNTINKQNEKIEIQIEGRHDVCVAPRAVPIIEALTAMVILDFYLINKAYSK